MPAGVQQANCEFWDGLLAAYTGDADAAAAHISAIEVLVVSDDNPRKLEGAHWVAGVSALTAGNFVEAAEQLRQADHANNMFVRYHLAIAEEGLGNVDAARELFAEVASYNFNSVAFALTRTDSAARAGL